MTEKGTERQRETGNERDIRTKIEIDRLRQRRESSGKRARERDLLREGETRNTVVAVGYILR